MFTSIFYAYLIPMLKTYIRDTNLKFKDNNLKEYKIQDEKRYSQSYKFGNQ